MTPAAPGSAVAPAASAVEVDRIHYRYGEREALAGVTFDVPAGEIFGLLGPNGGGKTTLFKILATLATPAEGNARVLGADTVADRDRVRSHIGVVFQHPSLDPKLTVTENIRHHGHLYGLRGATLRERGKQALARLGIAERAGELVERLSGGLQRRVELAKGLLSAPSVLLLDEPSTGLDPGARRDLWRYLRELRDEHGTTVLTTTHLMEEAECCDRLAILDRGRIVTIDAPDALRNRIGGDIVTIRSTAPEELCARIAAKTGTEPIRLGDNLRMEREQGHLLVRELVEAFPDSIEGISLAKPTLEDVFIHETGHRFWDEP